MSPGDGPIAKPGAARHCEQEAQGCRGNEGKGQVRPDQRLLL